MLEFSGCSHCSCRPPLNQKKAVLEFNKKAAKAYLLNFLEEYSAKSYLQQKFLDHSRNINLAAFWMKRHMHKKKEQVKQLADSWEKAFVRGQKIWNSEIKKAFDIYQLGQFVPFTEHAKLLSR